ncbi:18836_t:CDS:2 [Entrophospora sp. SA101]|nr:18836_t:CDS:2 [Entrophospora sp. SA101]
MGAIIQHIFLQEDKDEDESILLTILGNPDLAIHNSTRLNVINTCLKNQGLDSMMSTLCCDVIQTLFATTFELSDLTNYFRFAAGAITNLGTEPLQKITTIAFLKEFVEGFWNECIQDHNYHEPIISNLIGIDFDGTALIREINNFMSIPNPLIHSLKIYFLRILHNRHNLSLNDLKQFCNRLNNTFPWLASIVWEDHSQNRLPFNPYWALDMYAEADKGFSSLYSLKNKAPIKTFLQSVEKNESIGHRIAFGGVVVQRIHLVHASDEWTLDYDNASEDLKTEINGMMMLTPLYRQVIDNILQNKQPLLQLNTRETNETLLIKSVIGHIVILHSSIPADSSPLTVYLNNIQNCHMYYILTVQTEQLKLTRYLCQCGYKYFIVNCGQAIEANKCPQCKSNTIEGASQNVTVMDESNNVDYSVRTMPPNAYRILHLIVHALIGSSNSAKDFLKQIASNIEEYCFRHIQNDWKVLKNIFNCNDENLALLLHSILTEMSKKLFTGGPLIITTPAQQDEWELQFTKDYVEPQTKSFNESVTNFHRKLDAGLKRANGNANIIESEINQTIDMDNNYKVEYLPNLWRTIGTISFESFRAYYLADQINNNKTYPFLSIFFKHSEKLSQVKHLFPIIKFAEILASRLVYRINRKDTHNKSFQEFINDESNGGIVRETHETLIKTFDEFSEAWNAVRDQVKRYQIHEFKSVIPSLSLDSPIVFAIVEEKDTGIFICAIINYLVTLQNNFLQEITKIPNGSCKSLKFLEKPPQVDVGSTSSDDSSSSSTTAQANNPQVSNQYYIQSSRASQLRKSNVIDYEWDEDILQYSQRILTIGHGDDVIYDLKKIELELAYWLGFDKAYIETVQDSQLYLEPFSYHMELFQGYSRILSDIKNIIPQEPIPTEKLSLIRGEVGNINNNIFVSSPQYTNNYSLDDANNILSSLEVLLCFIKHNAIGQEDMLIQDYVKQWMKLSLLMMKPAFANLLNADLSLKHIVALYEFVEEQRLPKERKFQETIWYLTQISNYKEGLKNLEQVIKIFQDSHDKENQIGIIYNSLNEGKLSLGVLISFFNKFNTEFKISNECWNLIKELSEAGTFVTFLKSIEGHDIKNLINSVDDHPDEQLIQEDTVSSLIEVKKFLIPLLDVAKKRSVKEFVEEIGKVIVKNPKLTNNIVLCNNNCMALENMYKNIDQKNEVTKEKIKNAVMKGSYTFKRDANGDKCNALMTYTSDKVQKSSYTFNDLQDLRGHALLIAKPTVVNLNLSVENVLEDDQNIKNSMDVFVEQVDVAQDIINFSSKLVQIGHFEFRKFDVTVKGTDKMKELLKQCKEKLREWEDIMNKAQENHYYLTFFPGRHILTFYDYFSNVNNPNVIEECQILIRFVNRRAELPSDKKIMGISSKKNNYYDILCEIGKKLQLIFEKLPKKIRQVKNIDDCVISDVVLNGKLFVAACDEELHVPNIIMSLYANHRSCPEPWQLLICTPLTTSEELTNFIKRCFFAANNGHKDHLFCIANLELLDFELQYNLVKFIRLMCKHEKNYLLALICCREPGIHHHILDQFSQDVCVTNGLNTESMKTIFHDLCPNVTSLSSDLSGQGKTEWIKQDSFEKGKVTCSLLISDGLNFSKLVSQLKECKLRKVESLHLNIVSAENPSEVNMFLFELLILGIVSNSVDIAILPATEIYIEVSSTTEQKLLNSMPITSYLRRKHLSWDTNNLVISQEINSPIQIVCHYLNAFDRKAIEEIDILFKTDKKITVPLPKFFVNVFADQLVRFSSSQYFQVENLKLMVKEKNIRSTLFDTLLEISKDFATKSIKTKAAQLESTSNSEAAKLGTIVKWDDSNHLLVPNNVKMLLKSQSVGQKKDELDDYNQLEPKVLLDILEGLARRTLPDIKHPNYALSTDNLIKMALILLRAHANIPVIVCGEAGCGKVNSC